MARITKKQAIAKLDRATRKAGELQSKVSELQGKGVNDLHFIEWRKETRACVEDILGGDSRHLSDFTKISYNPYMQPSASDEICRKQYLDGLNKAQILLKALVDEIRRDWPDDMPVFPRNRLLAIITFVILLTGALVGIVVAILEYGARFLPR